MTVKELPLGPGYANAAKLTIDGENIIDFVTTSNAPKDNSCL